MSGDKVWKIVINKNKKKMLVLTSTYCSYVANNKQDDACAI